MISEAAMYIDVPKGSITVAINGHKSLYAADLLTAITVLFFVSQRNLLQNGRITQVILVATKSLL